MKTCRNGALRLEAAGVEQPSDIRLQWMRTPGETNARYQAPINDTGFKPYKQ